MFARVVRIHGPTGSLAEARRRIEEDAIPALRALPGYCGTQWLLDRRGGEGLVITTWESAEALRDSDALRARIREGLVGELGIAIEHTDTYEVLAHDPHPPAVAPTGAGRLG
jgi:hypothetical protein